MLALLLSAMIGADAPKRIVEPRWEPSPGDRAETRMTTVAASSLSVLQQVEKFRRASDEKGLEAFLKNGTLATLPKGVGILIIKRHDFRPRPGPSRFLGDLESANRDAITSALSGPPKEPPPNILEVRILDGKFKDQLRFVPEEDIWQLIAPPTPKRLVTPGMNGNDDTFSVPDAAAKTLGSPEIPTAERPVWLLEQAKRGERRKDLILAVMAYFFLATDYPDTKDGQTAKKWLDLRGWEYLGKGVYRINPNPPKRKR